MKGVLIALEGLDGSGKSTLLLELGRRLDDAGRAHVLTQEPYSSNWKHVVQVCGSSLVDAPHARYTALLAFLMDRQAHVREVIAPALARGDVVVCDRYVASTWAYQQAMGIPSNCIGWASALCDAPPADLEVYLDLSPEECAARIGRRGEGVNPVFERLPFLRRVCGHYEGYYSDVRRVECFEIVDASQSPTEVANQAWTAIQSALEKRGDSA